MANVTALFDYQQDTSVADSSIKAPQSSEKKLIITPTEERLNEIDKLTISFAKKYIKSSHNNHIKLAMVYNIQDDIKIIIEKSNRVLNTYSETDPNRGETSDTLAKVFNTITIALDKIINSETLDNPSHQKLLQIEQQKVIQQALYHEEQHLTWELCQATPDYYGQS